MYNSAVLKLLKNEWHKDCKTQFAPLKKTARGIITDIISNNGNTIINVILNTNNCNY